MRSYIFGFYYHGEGFHRNATYEEIIDLHIKNGGKRQNPFRLFRLLLHFPNFVKLTWRLFVDERVPVYRKAILILAELLAVVFAVAYLVNPLDFDFIPIFGRIDDLLIGAFVILVPSAWLFIRLCPEPIVREHVERISRGE